MYLVFNNAVGDQYCTEPTVQSNSIIYTLGKSQMIVSHTSFVKEMSHNLH